MHGKYHVATVPVLTRIADGWTCPATRASLWAWLPVRMMHPPPRPLVRSDRQRKAQRVLWTGGSPAIGPDTGGVVLNLYYKHSRVKQYLKDGRAMRIETVINAPRDIGCNARLHNLEELQAKARAVNRRILEAERAGQGTVLASPAFERIAHPSVNADGRRTPALRFGDPRVQALAGALTTTLLSATGITNKSLRALMTGLHHPAYSPGQMTYDLRRLRLAGLITRIERTNRYVLTPDGIKVAVFYTKLHNRLLRPLLAADQPQAPPELRHALRTIDRHIEDYITRARLTRAA